MSDERRVFLVCTDDEMAKDVGDCLKRVSSALSAVNQYYDSACELDEDAPDFYDKIGPIQLRFVMTLMGLYPNSKQFDADIKSIGDFTVRKIDL